MRWFVSLSLTNKLLLSGVVAFAGFLVFASNDFSAFSADRTYNPVKKVDEIKVTIDLQRAVLQSDGISGDTAIDEGTGSRNPVFREFSASGDIEISTTAYASGRRSYASLERRCIANPTMYPSGWTCDQVPIEDIQSNPYAIGYGTAQELLVYFSNTEGAGYPVYPYVEGGVGAAGKGLGGLVGEYVAEHIAFAVTDYNRSAKVTVPVSGSDEYSQQKKMGTYTAFEESVKGWETLATTSYANYYTDGHIYDYEQSALVVPDVPEIEPGECLPGDSLWECLGKKLGLKVKDLANETGQKKTFEESNFSMTVSTKDANLFNYAYALGANFQEKVCLIYGEYSEQCQNCKVDPDCPEASVEEAFTLWTEGSAYPFAEKNVYMQDYFMGVLDTTGAPRNFISAPFVDSYNVTGTVNVSGSGVYKSTNRIDGKLYEVASRAPAMMLDDDLQLAAQLDPSSLNYIKAPGYTCEFKGKTTNGWLDYSSNVSMTSNPPITIVGSNVGDEGDLADHLSIKVGQRKVLSKEILQNGGYTAVVDGNRVELAETIKSTDTGIAKYRDVGPSIHYSGGKYYVAFTAPVGKEPLDPANRTRYGAFLAEISYGGNLAGVTQISDRASRLRAMNIAENRDGNIVVLYQSADGTCGSGDPPGACLYLATYDINDRSVGTPVKLNDATHVSGYYTAMDVEPYFGSGSISGFAGSLPPLFGSSNTMGEPIVVFQGGAGSASGAKNLYVASGGNIVQFPDLLSSHNVAMPLHFEIDGRGFRHLVTMRDNIAYHAQWRNESGGELNGYFVETVPLPLANTGSRVKIGGIELIGTRLVVMYTVYPKDDGGSSAVVFLAQGDEFDYLKIGEEGSYSAVAGSVWDAYVIDQNAIVDWTADNLARPALEGKIVSAKNGRIDAALGFGMFGWTIFVEDVTGYSATSRVWSRLEGDEFSFAYTAGTGSGAPLPVRHMDNRYYLGEHVLPNSEGVAELMTLIDQSVLADGVEIISQKMPYLQYVDNVSNVNTGKSACWRELKKYSVVVSPEAGAVMPSGKWKCAKDSVTGENLGCVEAGPGDEDVYESYMVCSVACPIATLPVEPITPDPGTGGYCTESWCFTGPIYGSSVQPVSAGQIAELTKILIENTGRGEQLARQQIEFLCSESQKHNVSCPFMFAIWFQESSLSDQASSYSNRHLEFGCLLEGHYGSLEAQMNCAIEKAIRNRGVEWAGMLSSGGSSLRICGESCCVATTEFGYIMEKYTPTDSTPSHGNSQGRENLRFMIQRLIDRGVITLGSISTSTEVCNQISQGSGDMLLYPVGKNLPLPNAQTYIPGSLVNLSSDLVCSNRGIQKGETVINESLNLMIADCRGDAAQCGANLKVRSAYRDYTTQSNLYNACLSSGGGVCNSTAKPGESEHQLGTTIDILPDLLCATGFPQCSDWDNCDTLSGCDSSCKSQYIKAFKWLRENSYKYGFVVSYTPWNGDYIFEPWHLRYVGISVATNLKELGYTTDESVTVKGYLESIQ